MVEKIFNWKFVLFVVVFLFTFILRAHNYERFPTPSHLDEQLYAWSGIYLVEEGVPVSWSTLGYPDRARIFEGKKSLGELGPSAYVTLYKPWLDQPPLFSYLVGYFAHLFGANRNDWIPSSYIRFPIVIISSFSSVILFFLGSFVGGYWLGLLSMLIYGTVPIFVFASRSAMPESLISFFYLLLVFLVVLFRRSGKIAYLFPTPFLVGLAGISKPTGFFLFFILCLFVAEYFLPKKKFRETFFILLYFLLVVSIFVVFFFGWGIHLDSEIFWRILKIQSDRPAGFASLAHILVTPSVDTSVFLDSWYIFGLVIFSYFLFTKKKEFEKIIIFSFLYWLLVVMISSGEKDLLAWYRFPAFPFLAIIISWGIVFLVKKADFFSSFLAFGLLLGNRHLLVTPILEGVAPFKYRLVMFFLFSPSLVGLFYKSKFFIRFNRLLIVLVVVVGLCLNTVFTYRAYGLVCENKLCPLVPSTFLSELPTSVLKKLVPIPSR